MSTFSLNGNVATKPFVKTSVKTEVRNGFGYISQKLTLTPLEVVIGNMNHTVPTGAIVYVPSEYCAQAWATRVYTLDDKEFILVPESAIVFVKAD